MDTQMHRALQALPSNVLIFVRFWRSNPSFSNLHINIKTKKPKSIFNKVFFYSISTAFKSHDQYSNTVKIPPGVPIYSLFITPGTEPILILISIHKPAYHICIILIFLTCFQIRNLLLNPGTVIWMDSPHTTTWGYQMSAVANCFLHE